MENIYQTIIRAVRPWWRIDWRELWEYQDLLWSNPMSFVVECTRWMFTGTGTISFNVAVISIATTLFILVSGLFTQVSHLIF